MKALALTLLLLPCAALAADNGQWYRVTTGAGDPIGYEVDRIAPAGDGRDIVSEQHIDIDAVGDPSPHAPAFSAPGPVHSSQRIVRHEDGAGHTQSILSETHIGDDWVRNTAHVAGDTALILHETPGGAQTSTVPLPHGVRFDGGDVFLPVLNRPQSPQIEFDDLDIDAIAVDHVVLTPGPSGTVLRLRYNKGALMTVSRLTLDADGHVVESRQPMLGGDIVLRSVSETDARAPHPPYRMVLAAMIKSLYRIPDASLHGHIRYRFGFRDGIAFPLPETGEQRVAQDGDGATVDVCDGCGPGLSDAAAYLADASRPTSWLQSDAPEIVALAAGTLHAGMSDTEKMDALLRRTQQRLPRIDFIGHYSALDALKRGAGDCTESAALLAALGRAAGIPTRVVNGLVYSRERYHGVSNVFLPHSWTLAYVEGRWRSFDAAFGDFDSTHIALSVNDGDKRSAFAAFQLAGLLQWEAMQEVRARPAG